nr:AMP-binding protein [Actinomycetota bacterium]
MRFESPWHQAYDLIRSAEILRRRGLIRPLRLGQGLHTLRVARRAGPFAAMIDGQPRDAPAIVAEDGTLSYGELEARGNALARGLLDAGLRPADVAGIFCRDHCGAVLTLIAAGKLGVRVVLMNTGFGAPQLADVVRRENVTALFLDPEFLPLTGPLPAGIKKIATSAGDGAAAVSCLDDLIAGRSAAAVPWPDSPGGMVLLTSGTTGRPRGARRDKISPLQSAQLLDRVPLSRGGTMILATPLFHGTGLGQFVLALTLGQQVVLRRRFDPETTLADVAAHRAGTLIVVPTMLRRIVDLGPAVLAKYDTSSLRIIVCAGSALSPDLCRRTAGAFGDVLYNIYG